MYVWSLRELSTAAARSKNAGIQREDAAISSTRARAAGDMTANQMPASDAKAFCGAKKYTSHWVTSSGIPAAAEVPSMMTSAPSSPPSTRRTGAVTPVEVSLCAQAYTSMPASGCASGWVPGSLVTTVGSPRTGARSAARANLAPNSPNARCWLRSRISPKVAASKKAVEPPTPSTTS